MVLDIEKSCVKTCSSDFVCQDLAIFEVGGIEWCQVNDGDFFCGAVSRWGVQDISEYGTVSSPKLQLQRRRGLGGGSRHFYRSLIDRI